jgi:hypothetical protein
VRRSELEHELVLRAEVDLLQMLAFVQVPEVQAASVSRGEKNLRDEPVLDRVRRSPLAGHQGVVTEVPPHIVGELLWTAFHLPAAENLECLVIDEKTRRRERRHWRCRAPRDRCHRARNARYAAGYIPSSPPIPPAR